MGIMFGVRLKFHSLFLSALAVCVPFLSACSLKQKEDSSASAAKVSLAVGDGGGSASHLLNFGMNNLGGPWAPSTLGDFDCFMINVTGPGILGTVSNSNIGSNSNPNPACTYPGVMSQVVPNSSGEQLIDLEVPVGLGRIFQVIGLKLKNPGAGCPALPPFGSFQQSDFMGAREIGRTVAAISDDVVLDVQSESPANWLEPMCGGPDMQGTSSSSSSMMSSSSSTTSMSSSSVSSQSSMSSSSTSSVSSTSSSISSSSSSSSSSSFSSNSSSSSSSSFSSSSSAPPGPYVSAVGLVNGDVPYDLLPYGGIDIHISGINFPNSPLIYIWDQNSLSPVLCNPSSSTTTDVTCTIPDVSGSTGYASVASPNWVVRVCPNTATVAFPVGCSNQALMANNFVSFVAPGTLTFANIFPPIGTQLRFYSDNIGVDAGLTFGVGADLKSVASSVYYPSPGIAPYVHVGSLGSPGEFGTFTSITGAMVHSLNNSVFLSNTNPSSIDFGVFLLTANLPGQGQSLDYDLEITDPSNAVGAHLPFSLHNLGPLGSLSVTTKDVSQTPNYRNILVTVSNTSTTQTLVLASVGIGTIHTVDPTGEMLTHSVLGVGSQPCTTVSTTTLNPQSTCTFEVLFDYIGSVGITNGIAGTIGLRVKPIENTEFGLYHQSFTAAPPAVPNTFDTYSNAAQPYQSNFLARVTPDPTTGSLEVAIYNETLFPLALTALGPSAFSDGAFGLFMGTYALGSPSAGMPCSFEYGAVLGVGGVCKFVIYNGGTTTLSLTVNETGVSNGNTQSAGITVSVPPAPQAVTPFAPTLALASGSQPTGIFNLLLNLYDLATATSFPVPGIQILSGYFWNGTNVTHIFPVVGNGFASYSNSTPCLTVNYGDQCTMPLVLNDSQAFMPAPGIANNKLGVSFKLSGSAQVLQTRFAW